jgi:transposase-like protein
VSKQLTLEGKAPRISREDREIPVRLVNEVDTGERWVCSECGKKFKLIHIGTRGHRLDEVKERAAP